MRKGPAAAILFSTLTACGGEEPVRANLNAPRSGDFTVSGELQAAQTEAMEHATKVVHVDEPFYHWADDHDELVSDPTRLAHQCVPSPTTLEGEVDPAERAAVEAQDQAAQEEGVRKQDTFQKAVIQAQAALNNPTLQTLYGARRGEDPTLKNVDFGELAKSTGTISSQDLLCPTGTYYALNNDREVPVAAYLASPAHDTANETVPLKLALPEKFWDADVSVCQRAGILAQFEACQSTGACDYTPVTPIGGVDGAARNAPNTVQELVTQVCENPKAAVDAAVPTLNGYYGWKSAKPTHYTVGDDGTVTIAGSSNVLGNRVEGPYLLQPNDPSTCPTDGSHRMTLKAPTNDSAGQWLDLSFTGCWPDDGSSATLVEGEKSTELVATGVPDAPNTYQWDHCLKDDCSRYDRYSLSTQDGTWSVEKNQHGNHQAPEPPNQ